MYKTLLILKYLRKRRIAWVSLIAVMLCTTMVLVVISVMGGWLSMFRTMFHNLSGDVVVDARKFVGFPYYEEMIDRIKQIPEVQAAAPVIRTFGVANVDGQFQKPVEVIGYPPDIGEVNGFTESLNRLKGTKDLNFDLWPDVEYYPPPGFKLPPQVVRTWKGIIVGTGVIGLRKDAQGKIPPRDPYMYRAYIDLTVVPPSTSANIDLESKTRNFFWIIDDSRTKVYLYDDKNVYVPFDVLQRDLKMDANGNHPARASQIQVKLKDPKLARVVKDKIKSAVDAVAREKNMDIISYPYSVQSWDEFHGAFLGAVENEKGLLTILFGLISLVAVFLIFCIFYMIVVEKTRDIGIIKSVGATSSGVAGIFLGYGLAIGVVGAGLGLGLSWLIVHYINQLHAQLGRLGIVIWKPDVYLFDTIPNWMNPHEVIVIVTVAIVFSVLGALVPAIRAARMHPVEALRWE